MPNLGLSDEAKWPECRNDFLAAYLSLVEDYGIDPQKVVFGGDSAGGGLVAMSAIHTRREGLPRPGGLIMISPWLDLRMFETLNSPAMATDYLVTFQKENPKLVHLLLPQDMTPENPLVSPVLDDLSSLPPQLVLAGTAEVLLPDSKTWSRKSKEAGNRVELVLERGQMHM